MSDHNRMSFHELVLRYSDALSGGQVGDRTPPLPDTVWAGPGHPATQRTITKATAIMGGANTSNGLITPEKS